LRRNFFPRAQTLLIEFGVPVQIVEPAIVRQDSAAAEHRAFHHRQSSRMLRLSDRALDRRAFIRADSGSGGGLALINFRNKKMNRAAASG
jgi:hypothetical protein